MKRRAELSQSFDDPTEAEIDAFAADLPADLEDTVRGLRKFTGKDLAAEGARIKRDLAIELLTKQSAELSKAVSSHAIGIRRSITRKEFDRLTETLHAKMDKQFQSLTWAIGLGFTVLGVLLAVIGFIRK